MFSRAYRAALVWLCLWIYALGGMVRTAALVLCVGEGKITFTFADEAGGCACCATASCADGQTDEPDACTGSIAAHANDGCHCVDIPLVCGRDDHLPQHPAAAAKHELPSLHVAWLPTAAALPPLANAQPASSARCRAPPASAQSTPKLRRSVLLLV
jgi:hypothetical protein